jgi:hypothetical protein
MDQPRTPAQSAAPMMSGRRTQGQCRRGLAVASPIDRKLNPGGRRHSGGGMVVRIAWAGVGGGDEKPPSGNGEDRAFRVLREKHLRGGKRPGPSHHSLKDVGGPLVHAAGGVRYSFPAPARGSVRLQRGGGRLHGKDQRVVSRHRERHALDFPRGDVDESTVRPVLRTYPIRGTRRRRQAAARRKKES